ncbi:carbon storage regulator, partial [Intestinimonas butyriciproducens]
YVVINENIFVRVVKQNGDLKLAIDAPKDIKIERGEIFEKRSGRPASMAR